MRPARERRPKVNTHGRVEPTSAVRATRARWSDGGGGDRRHRLRIRECVPFNTYFRVVRAHRRSFVEALLSAETTREIVASRCRPPPRRLPAVSGSTGHESVDADRAFGAARARPARAAVRRPRVEGPGAGPSARHGVAHGAREPPTRDNDRP